MDASGKIWVALDCDKTMALKIAEALGDHPALAGFKVNRLVDREVFRQDGEPKLFEGLATHGKKLWADLKMHDISRTVAARIKPYQESGLVQYMTVMADGGIEMMIAAREAGGDILKGIAVTKLTSLSEEAIHLGSGHPAKAAVIQLAQWAVLAKIEYLVCSGNELEVIQALPWLSHLKCLIPAVRPVWLQNRANDDQKRVITPVEALQNGATAIIMGSPVVKEPNPLEALEKTVAEIEAA